MSEIVTRFAPSPTGFLHIGGARTALFNWLYARGRGGRFLLRVEDTDRERSTEEATAAILSGLEWLGLDWDGEPVFQAARVERHAEVVRAMLEAGHAYRCFSSREEIAAARERAREEGGSWVFASPWRDVPAAEHPEEPAAIRLRSPDTGETVVEDAVQGRVVTANDVLDDMVLMRNDGTPTYNLAVVVDDHDMGVTHVIRGDDHLTNAARQTLVYGAMGWDVPRFAHVPLIHGPDGAKLSKRHGALGVEEYQAMGYAAPGLRNYLARLGWSHGDDEVFDDDQAKEWFDLAGIGRSPARFDFAKLESLSGAHIARMEDAALMEGIDAHLAAAKAPPIEGDRRDGLARALYCLKERSKTYPELLDKARFVLASRPVEPDAKAREALEKPEAGALHDLTGPLGRVNWSREALEGLVAEVAERRGTKLGRLAAPIRAALAGRTVTPSVFDMMLVLGRDETVARLAEAGQPARAPDEGPGA